MRSCLPLHPTLNHDLPLVYPCRPGSPFRAESLRERGPGSTGAEPRDARAAAAARAGRHGSARRGATSGRPAGAGAAQPVHRALVSTRRLPAGVAVGAARAPRGRADRRHARDDSPAHRRRLPPAAPADPAGLRGAALAAPRLLAAAARRRPRSRRRGRSDRARGAADGTELRAFFAARFPELDAAALAYACQMRLALVQVPPRGLWGTSAQVRWTTAESWLGRPLEADPSLDDVVLRYLAAFGPASVADVATWCRLTGLRAVVERLRPAARQFPGRAGPRALRPPGRAAPGSGHARAGALPARVRQRPPLARRPQPVRLGIRSRVAQAGVVARLGRGAPRRSRARRLACSSRRPRRPPRAAGEASARVGRGGGTKARPLPRARRPTCGSSPSAGEAGAAAGERERAALGCERERVLDLHALGERDT